MVCPYCSSATKVINSRVQKRSNQTWRRRRCLKCSSVFTTLEIANLAQLWTVKDSKGSLRPFNSQKLFISLYESCRHRKSATGDAEALTDTIIQRIRPKAKKAIIDIEELKNVASDTLKRFDKAAFVHYQAYHKN